jgi:hypothetical protein
MLDKLNRARKFSMSESLQKELLLGEDVKDIMNISSNKFEFMYFYVFEGDLAIV